MGTPGRTFPSASMPACPRHASGPSPSPIRPSKRPLPIHSTRCATYTIVVTVGLRVTSHHSSTPGHWQLPDRPVGLGRRADAGFGRTARPLPIAVADSPIEAATPDPQHPMCYLWWPHHSEYPRPAAGPSRRPGPTGRYRHRAHGTPTAHCRRRFAHRSSHSRSAAPAVPPTLVPAPVMELYHCRSS